MRNWRRHVHDAIPLLLATAAVTGVVVFGYFTWRGCLMALAARHSFVITETVSLLSWLGTGLLLSIAYIARHPRKAQRIALVPLLPGLALLGPAVGVLAISRRTFSR